MKNYLDIIRQSLLFQGITAEELPHLLNCLNAWKKTYPRGDILLLAGTKAKEIGILIEGAAQITREDAEGERAILSEVETGDLFAEAYVAFCQMEVPITVVATKDCSVLWLPFEKVVNQCSCACQFHRRLIENLLQVIAGKNIALNERMRLFSCRTIRKKILTYLRDYREYVGKNRFTIPFRRNELADYLSVDRSALSRELGKLRDEKILWFSQNEFELYE